MRESKYNSVVLIFYQAGLGLAGRQHVPSFSYAWTRRRRHVSVVRSTYLTVSPSFFQVLSAPPFWIIFRQCSYQLPPVPVPVVGTGSGMIQFKTIPEGQSIKHSRRSITIVEKSDSHYKEREREREREREKERERERES
jgi:hypothetical protein